MPVFDWISRRYHLIHYGWLIVVVCTVTMAIAYGVMYSFSVFFKPVATHFNWSRSTVSSIFSVSLIFRGLVSIAIGWLADRYGPAKLSIFCGIMTGLGLFLSSRVANLWQFYITYGLIVSTGLSGAFTIGSTITAQWFTKGRGLALGFIAAGSGLGTLFIVPLTQRLIHWYSWNMVFAIYGIGAGTDSHEQRFSSQTCCAKTLDSNSAARGTISDRKIQMTLMEAIHSKELMVMVMIFFSFTFCLQMIMIHLVNFATDIGVAPYAGSRFYQPHRSGEHCRSDCSSEVLRIESAPTIP